MSESLLHLVVRTPREVVLERSASSIRVPTETGQVGVRPRAEHFVLAVEPGLVIVRQADRFEFVGTAGGLLRCDGATASLLTPLAVSGLDEEVVADALETALELPSEEMDARAMLGRLQTSILRELRDSKKGQARPVEGAR